MRALYFLLFCVYSVGCSNDDQIEIENNRKRLLEQLTKSHTVLLDGYHLVTRQIATDVYMFRSYRSVSVLFYPIGRDIVDARFTFQSEELHLNNIGSCSPKDVIINIKHGAYPAVNPDGYDFPKNFIDTAHREDIHTIELQSDGSNRTYSIKNPKPGNWYAVVYRKWEDPRTQKVEQEGLVASCSTILYSDLQVKGKDDTELIDCYSGATVDAADLPATFKCMSVDSSDQLTLNLTIIGTSTNTTNVLFRIQAKSFPTEDSNLLTCAFDPILNNAQSISFTPHPSAWHYMEISNVTNASTASYANCESYYLRTDLDDLNFTFHDLMRDDKGRSFTFDYGLPTTDVQEPTSLVNLTSDEIKSLRFNVNPFVDIGGNVVIEASFLMSLKYYMGYRRELKKGALLAFTEDSQFFKAVICLNIDHASVPLETGQCKYNDVVKPALFILNSTDSESIYDKIIIPYPESGVWYLTFRLFCDDTVCPCHTSHNDSRYYVTSNALEKDGADISDELTDFKREGGSKCNATVVLSISSTACMSGRCSNHGNCMLNTFSGLGMSFCSCFSGYGGWDCSDSSRMDTRTYMLISTLLLTLSNLLFFFSIYVATIRMYYTEAMMYAFTMVFSTFYHACDAPSQVAYCITRGNILQFGDFYCGIMSFWVTLLAMSLITDRLRSSLQLIGAIVIALLTTWNMHSFVAFLTPVAVGVFVLLLSWYLGYRTHRAMIYPRSYYTIYLPLGIGLVSIGLICYAFLQTEQNYKIVHSFWHMIIALSVVFLLPDVNRKGSRNAFLPSPGYCKIPFRNLFRKPSRTPSTTETNNLRVTPP